MVRLQQIPFATKLFKPVATDDSIELLITNYLTANLTQEVVIDAVQIRWQIKEFHRSFKQLTGAEKCPRRKASYYHNQLTFCYLPYLPLRQCARAVGQTVYKAHQRRWAACLRQQLQNPPFPVLLPATA